MRRNVAEADRLHIAFAGAHGTGKTTIARVVAVTTRLRSVLSAPGDTATQARCPPVSRRGTRPRPEDGEPSAIAFTIQPDKLVSPAAFVPYVPPAGRTLKLSPLAMRSANERLEAPVGRGDCR